jgi:hypothetical protein
MPVATEDPNVDVAITRIADIAMVSRGVVQKALRGEFSGGREGDRVAVALRALGVPCEISPDLAMRLATRRISHTHNPVGQLMSLTRTLEHR